MLADGIQIQWKIANEDKNMYEDRDLGALHLGHGQEWSEPESPWVSECRLFSRLELGIALPVGALGLWAGMASQRQS